MYQAYAYEFNNQKDAGGDAILAESPLITATQRLVGALERLEYNLQQVAGERQQGARQQEQLGLFERENASLRQEREHLSVTLSQLQYRYDDLQHVAGTIYGKLDESIKRLTQIIGN